MLDEETLEMFVVYREKINELEDEIACLKASVQGIKWASGLR